MQGESPIGDHGHLPVRPFEFLSSDAPWKASREMGGDENPKLAVDTRGVLSFILFVGLS